MLLSPRPDMLLMMLLTALALAYCAYLVPAILIVTVEWHGFASTCWAYCVTVFVLSLVTGILASIDTEAFTPSYAVFNKIVVPAFAIPMFPFFAVLGMFDAFTRLPADVPEMPSDLALLKETSLAEFTGAHLVRALRIAKNDGYIVPPMTRPVRGRS